jgi:hypothetical protein
MAVIAVAWTWWRGSGSDGSPDTPTDRRANRSPTPATGDRTDGGPCARAEETAADGAFGRVIGVCRGYRCQHQSGADNADNYRWVFHSRKFSD